MLSRCNLYAITLANARLGTLGRLHRSCVCYSVCLAKKRTMELVHRPAPIPSYDRVSFNLRLPQYSTSPPPQQPPPPPQPPPPSPPIENDDKSQSIFQRFKNMAKKYWYIVLPVHLLTSTVWFGSFYLIASSGVDVPALLHSLRFPDWIIEKVKNGNSWTSYLVIAYGLYKIFTPLRYMVTLGGSTMVIRYLRRLGYNVGDPPSLRRP